MAKTLSNKNVADAESKVSDIKVIGNGDAWQLICKAYSESEGWMKSTKAMYTGKGCLVQVTSQQGDQVAEALEYVPGLKIKTDKEGHKSLGH